ncbi:MAG: tyrosine recombinase [Deltaproteobacteria bacterium CG_4_9_14_3_um_filter_65_9]|nr:MAG: tyrosine recombinase [Deltaproteobacteria bacterium CG_4_9_14_3_um_filter_65_9]
MELIKLLIYDLTIDHGTLMIREGKGKMDRLIPIGDRALAWIRKYLDEVRPSFVTGPDDGTLFLKATGEPITPSALTHIVSKYVKEADIGKSGSCHMFRHTMATLMLEGGADVRYIQQMLGHAKLETTSIYTHVSIRKLQEVYRTTHPGANLKPDREEEKTKERGIAPDPAGRGRQPGP